MGDKLITILNELTALTKDVDLFYLEIPLGKSGLWVSEAQVPSTFNGTGYQEFDVYYRSKSKTSSVKNLKYLKESIDAFSGSQGVCRLSDGSTFRLQVMWEWEFMEKDSEGYFVWANRMILLYDEPTDIISV